MQVRVNSQKPLLVSLAGLVAVSWLALLAWGASPYGRFLSHDPLEVMLRGAQSEKAIRVGDPVVVQVASVDPPRGRVELSPVQL